MILSVAVIIGFIMAAVATWDACNGFPISDRLLERFSKNPTNRK